MSDPRKISELIASRFIERRDAKAIQSSNGGYMPVRVDPKDKSSDLVPWKLSDVVDHVEGRKTYGHYVVDTGDTCRCIVFDVDLRKKANPDRDEQPIVRWGREIDPRDIWMNDGDPAERKELASEMRAVAEALASRANKMMKLTSMVSYSGAKGMHAYVCLDPESPAVNARVVGRAILESFSDGEQFRTVFGNNFYSSDSFDSVTIEMFPKQDSVDGGFGNLLRLPLGINRKTGKYGFFLDVSQPPNVFKKADPLLTLQEGSFRG